MYSPLIKAFNYALDRLSKFEVPGLPRFQKQRQIVFARSDPKCIESESYLQGSYKPDIVLVKWDVFKRAHRRPRAVYSDSYESRTCCESACDQPSLSWRNLLSTLEVKRGGSRGAGPSGNKQSKGKEKAKSVKLMYTGKFGELQRDLEAAGPSAGSSRPSLPSMVAEEYSTRTCSCIIILFLSFAFSSTFSWDTLWAEGSSVFILNFGSPGLYNAKEAPGSAGFRIYPEETQR